MEEQNRRMKDYVAPRVEVIEVEVERGFSSSVTVSGGTDGEGYYGDDSGTPGFPGF